MKKKKKKKKSPNYQDLVRAATVNKVSLSDRIGLRGEASTNNYTENKLLRTIQSLQAESKHILSPAIRFCLAKYNRAQAHELKLLIVSTGGTIVLFSDQPT